MKRGPAKSTTAILAGERMRANLTGDQPKLFEPWMTMDEEAVTE